MPMEKQIQCLICNRYKSEKEFGVIYSKKYDKFFKLKKTCKKCYDNKDRRRLKYLFLKAFNFKCQCCGESDIRFLTLDHVKNDGYKTKDRSQCMKEALYDKFDKEIWSCLCYNCNMGKHRNGGQCPHHDKEDKEKHLKRFCEGIHIKKTTTPFKKIYSKEDEKVRVTNLLIKKELSNEEIVKLIEKLAPVVECMDTPK